MTVYLTVAHSSKMLQTTKRKYHKIQQRYQGGNAKKNSFLDRKITMVISTDFLCWMPFIFVCSLHYFEVLDATKWYSLFSIVILTLNSVIDP